jgi:hypothetical protein
MPDGNNTIGWLKGDTYEQREGLLELGDLLLGKRISLWAGVSSARQWIVRLPLCFAGRGMETGGTARGRRTMIAGVEV